MKSDTLKQAIRNAAITYAHKRGIPIDDSYTSAVIFRNLSDNFHPDSFKNIINTPAWQERTTKAHQNVPGALEMQSSNSSDALLMNIFCHPDISRWKGIVNLLDDKLGNIAFGFSGKVHINGNQTDSTEIDLALANAFCEAKLTESDFTQKKADVVERYNSVRISFHLENIPRIGEDYDNYQIIRNLLAAIQHRKKHILLCDERRPDLTRRYMQTVSCLSKMHDRNNCRVVFWQELVVACGASLREWIEEKYGMCQQ